MNKCLNLFGVVFVYFLLGSFSLTTAAPIGRSNSGRDYLAGTQDLGAWSCGLYFMSIDREVELFKSLPNISMKSDKVMGYVGYDIFPWMMAYIIGGSSETRIGWGNVADSKGEFGVGLLFNILDTEIEDPTFMEDRLRLNAHIQYTKSSATYSDGITDIDWNDFSGSLTLSLVNDLEGDKFFVPSSIALFAGPAFSILQSNEIEQEDEFGFVIGLDVFLNEKVSLEVAYTQFEESAYSFGVNVRF